MSCPDRLTLFLGLEENDPAIRAHLDACEHCQAIAEEEMELDAALGRLRDPAPPSDLIANVLLRVDDAEALSRAARHQLAGILLALLAIIGGSLAAIGPEWLLQAALDSASRLGSLGTALAALGRSLAPQLTALAVPVVAAQALALVASTLVLHRLVAVRVRS